MRKPNVILMLHKCLESALQSAVKTVLPEADASGVLVRPCPDPKFGDYQTNALMSLAKERRMNPRQLATDVVAKLDASLWCEKPEIAGAGFINFRIKPEAYGRFLAGVLRGDGSFIARADVARTVVVDFSSPNVAKPMHVGHIRSTCLGDVLSRVLRRLGHRVVTDNHVGDWGTQFGKLLHGWKTQLREDALAKDPIGEMERLYREVNAASEADPAVLEACRRELVKLQGGDTENLGLWRRMIELSQAQFDTIYGRLDVRFDHVLGESFYNPFLKDVVAGLVQGGIATESDGALVAFFPDVPALKDHPAIIQKRDGAANYATTDLATLAYRVNEWQPDEIVYVTDGRQQLHFKQVFATFQRWKPDVRVKLAHVWFGSILGKDGTPFKTRSGDTVKLADLLDEAEDRALRIVEAKNPGMDPEERRRVAKMIGLGAVKYADLLPNRQSDYVFDWDKMLALSGNTAPYLQYAHARICSIFRKSGDNDPGVSAWKAAIGDTVALGTSQEVLLARHLLNFGLVLDAVAEDYRPNYLCNYLYELAGYFTAFFENCPVLKAEEPLRSHRLALCDLTRSALAEGLGLLGIEAPERM